MLHFPILRSHLKVYQDWLQYLASSWSYRPDLHRQNPQLLGRLGFLLQTGSFLYCHCVLINKTISNHVNWSKSHYHSSLYIKTTFQNIPLRICINCYLQHVIVATRELWLHKWPVSILNQKHVKLHRLGVPIVGSRTQVAECGTWNVERICMTNIHPTWIVPHSATVKPAN